MEFTAFPFTTAIYMIFFSMLLGMPAAMQLQSLTLPPAVVDADGTGATPGM